MTWNCQGVGKETSIRAALFLWVLNQGMYALIKCWGMCWDGLVV